MCEMNPVRYACVIVVLLGVWQWNAAAQTLAEPFATGFNDPVFVTAPEGDERLFVVEQPGVIRIIDGDGETLPAPFLDIVSLVTSGGEQGLLGMAFHPDYEANGLFFVHYSSAETGKIGDTVLARYSVSGGDPNVANPSSAQIFLEAVQPFSNHNGGMIAFKPGDPENYLYMALGDGGSGGDPQNNAQNLNTVLGKILRIDVDAGAPATAPASNPFVGIEGDDLIWSYGLRNPWRFSFDRATGDMYIGDVGQDNFEEIDFAPSSSPGGENYGWRLLEGTHDFNCFDCDAARATTVLPIHEYPHSDGFAVTGGYVYRGSDATALQGKYLFADNNGSVWSLRRDGETTSDFVEHGTEFYSGGQTVVSFGEDGAGELYIVRYAGTIYKITDLADPEVTATAGGGLHEEGDTVILSAEITGTQGGVAYAWFKDGSVTSVANGGHISGADSASLIFDPIELADTGVYILEFTDESKQTFSGPPISVTVVEEGALPALGSFGLGLSAGIIVYLAFVRRAKRVI